MSMLLVVSCVFALGMLLIVRQVRDGDTKSARSILDRGKDTSAVAIKPVPGSPGDFNKSHKDSPKVPPYACWDNTMLAGNVLGTVAVNPGEDHMKKCSQACHKKRTCTHFDFKDNKCVLKDRAAAYMDMTFRSFNQRPTLKACGNGTRCADGYEKNRKVCLDSVMFQLDAKRPGGPTNRQAMQNMVDVLTDAHKQANKSKVWDILSLVFTVAGLVFAPFSFMSGPLAAVIGAVDLAAFATDTVTGTVNSIREVKDMDKFVKALGRWAKTPNDIPVFLYHNMPKSDSDKLVWGYQCVKAAKQRGELCRQNSDTGIAWNDQLDVHYLKEGDKRTSVCCKPRKDAGESFGNCDDMYDPADTGSCDFNSKEYKHAMDSSQRLLKSAAWQSRPAAPDNYSNTMLSYVLKFGQVIA